jgi:hypothetical protein
MWLIHQLDSFLHLGACKEYPIMARAKTPRTNTGKTNGDAAAPTVTPVTPVNPSVTPEPVAEFREVRKAQPEVRKNIVPINLEDEIRRRAYELWEQHGRAEGHENEHWLLAEREVRERYQSQHQQSA